MADSFEELELAPELVEALAAEGLERPTPLQEAAIPVVRRGNNLVAVAGPGAGVLVAVVAPLLERIVSEGHAPVILHLTPTREAATAVAEALGRVAFAAGHRVAVAAGAWALPTHASMLVATPADALAWLTSGRFSLEGIRAVIVEGASSLQASGDLADAETLLEALPAETQRIVTALPLTPEVSDLVERHVKRAVHVPPRAVDASIPTAPDRGEVGVRVIEGPRHEVVASVCEDLLSEDLAHLSLFVRTEDEAADLGDLLALRGFQGGPAGDPESPLWLAVDDLEARTAMDASERRVGAVSVTVPNGPDAMDRRHGGGRGGVILVETRELPHLEDMARRTGYRLRRSGSPTLARSGALADLLTAIEAALAGDSLDAEAYQVVLEPLVEAHGANRVAGVLLGLLRARGAVQGVTAPSGEAGAGRGGEPERVKLFVSIGQRDGVGPGDLVGAITGESGIDGRQVGRIDLRESFSLVEVDSSVADRVIRALNGTTVRGRSVRVDLDRNERARATRKPHKRT